MAKNEDDAPLFPVMTGGKNFKSDFYERVPFDRSKIEHHVKKYHCPVIGSSESDARQPGFLRRLGNIYGNG